jgi:hypothetical protein
MFYFNEFLHNLSNLILFKFNGIETNYWYVYQTNFILKISHMNFFLHFIYRYETSQYKKAGDNLKK